MDDFLSKYWELTCFVLGLLAYMLKLYIDNTMLKFSKLTADNMTKEIKDLMKLTERHHKEIQEKIKDSREDVEKDLKSLRSEIRYIKDNYVREKGKR